MTITGISNPKKGLTQKQTQDQKGVFKVGDLVVDSYGKNGSKFENGKLIHSEFFTRKGVGIVVGVYSRDGEFGVWSFAKNLETVPLNQTPLQYKYKIYWSGSKSISHEEPGWIEYADKNKR